MKILLNIWRGINFDDRIDWLIVLFGIILLGICSTLFFSEKVEGAISDNPQCSISDGK